MKQPTPNGPPHFERLPIEVSSKIFDFLSFQEKKKARLVCHLWRFILDGKQPNYVFRTILSNHSAKYFFNTYQENMNLVSLRNMTGKMPEMISTHNIFPRIKHAALEWKNSPINITKFLISGCEYSEILLISKLAFEWITREAILNIIPEIKWSHLKDLRLHIILTKYNFQGARKHMVNSTVFLKFVKVPNLECFDLKFVNYLDRLRNQGIRKLFVEFYSFLTSHGHSLKSLTCSIENKSRVRFDIPSIPKNLKKSMSSTQLALITCQIQLWGVEELESLVSPILLGCKLKTFMLDTSEKFQVNPDADFHPDLDANLGKIFTANAGTLETVELSLTVIDLSWLRDCSLIRRARLSAEREIQSTPDLILSANNLKALEFCSLPLPIPILEMLHRNKTTIETLGLVTNSALFEEPTNFHLKEFIALKYLAIVCTDLHNMAAKNDDVILPNLVECQIAIFRTNRQDSCNWIAKSMPNLEKINIFGKFTNIQEIETFLEMSKIREIGFFTLDGVDPQIVRHCLDTSGLKLKSENRANSLGHTEHHIIIDRHIFKVYSTN